MKHASLIAAAALVLVANGFALLHASRNRSGADAEITLTDRELTYYPDKDDSGVALGLRWIDSGAQRYSPALKPEDLASKTWLDKAKLEELGFDCSVDPSASDAWRFYSRQSARTVFVAMELDGPAWQQWIEESERIARAEAQIGQTPVTPFDRIQGSRLVVIDAARDAGALRLKYTDRTRIVIAPAVIRISLTSSYSPGKPSMLAGYIQEIPSVVHVPRPYSQGFTGGRRYSVRLRYGRFYEPWVVGVEFAK